MCMWLLSSERYSLSIQESNKRGAQCFAEAVFRFSIFNMSITPHKRVFLVIKMLYVNGGNKPHLNDMHVTTEINAK